jgi:hypothetical protein
MRWPTRGDLADDTHLIEQVRSTLTGSELTSVDEILWSGRVHGGRAVLVAGFDVRSGIDSADAMPVVGILVADGRDVAQGQVVRVADLTGAPGQVIAWSLPGGHQVLLVGRPGPLRAELSPTVTFTPSGQPQRAWSPVEGADGWALVDVPADDHPALAVRTATRTFAFGDATERHVPDIAVAGLGDPGYAGPEPQTVRALVLHLCFDDPLYGWRASARVSWSGELADGRRAVVVVVTRADGAVFQAAVIGTAAAGATTFGLRPVARTAPERRPYLFVQDRAHLGTAPLLVVDPAGRAELRVVSALGTTSFRTDAHGVLTLPADALDAATAVVVRDRFGSREVTVDDLVAADPDGLSPAWRY